VLVDLGIFALVGECARLLLFELPTDHVRVARVTGRDEGRVSRLADERFALSGVARSVRDLAPDEDRAAVIRETVDDLRAHVSNRLALLRLLGPAASCVGLAGAAAQMSWMRSDHGVLDLDPDRVLWMAVSAGTVCMALGIAGSTTAIGALFFFRPRARTILQAVDRFADQLSGSPPSWTSDTT
jgi:hypothetical protein